MQGTIGSGKDVIDLCSGDGWFTLQIASHGASRLMDPNRTSACKVRSVLPVAAVSQVPLVNQCSMADPHEGAVAMKLFGNIFLIACLLLAGGWLWLTSTLHQQRGAAVWLTAGVIVFIGIACRYFFAAGDKA